MQVNLRGVSTINAGADPIWVIDGIVVSNEAIPNGADAVTRPRPAATRATRTTRPTASPTSTPRTSSGSRC